MLVDFRGEKPTESPTPPLKYDVYASGNVNSTCVRACVRACVRTCVRACARACVRNTTMKFSFYFF